MDEAKIIEIVETVIREILAASSVSELHPAESGIPFKEPVSGDSSPATQVAPQLLTDQPDRSDTPVNIDLPDPTLDLHYKPGVKNPQDPAALIELIASTSARIGVGRAGPRYTTAALLRFQGDHAITQDDL